MGPINYKKFTVGVEEEQQPDFVVYPNPAQEFLTIQSTNKSANTPYTIYAIGGDLVQSGNVIANQRIDLHKLSAGLYSIVMAGEVARFVKK